MSVAGTASPPFILAVAPNGARKTKADHSALPMTPDEIARTAAECREAGAAMIHLHVRDRNGGHSLDADLYRDAIRAVRREVGDRLVVQVTSESVGCYAADQQMAMVREVMPEAVSLAVREILPDGSRESSVARFYAWARQSEILVQHILYSEDDLARFNQLVKRQIIPGNRHCVLFVLGRYSKDQRSSPADLLPFLCGGEERHIWFICAFGPLETACAVAGAAFGGHARVGFENNLLLPDGERAGSNAELVAATASAVSRIGMQLADAAQARAIMSA